MIIITILLLIMAIAIPNISLQLSPIVLTRVTSIAFIYAGVISYNTFYIQSIGSGISIYSDLFSVTLISQIFETFIYVIASLILVAWLIRNNKIETSNHSLEYSLIVLFSTLGASLWVSSADLISMYLSIELQSFGVYILSTIYRFSYLATLAGLKYLLVGFLINYLFFKLVLIGKLGFSIQNYVSRKIELNDSSWLNNLLIIYFALNFTLMCNSLIYLDNTVISFTVENIKFDISGEILSYIVSSFGSSAAFVIGSKIGYTSAIKANLGIFGKSGVSVLSGYGSSIAWKMSVTTSQYIEGVSKVTYSESESVVTVNLENVTINTEMGTSLGDKVLVNKSNINSLFQNNNFTVKNTLFEKLQEKTTSNSKIIEMVDKQSKGGISQLFKTQSNIEDFSINSPLEPSELNPVVIQNQVLELLKYNLILHYVMLYLIIMCIFIFTIKLITDKNISIEFIKTLPLGKYLYIFINKLLVVWRNSNTFWIYFILFVLLIFLSVATYSLYGSIILVKHI